ncbi:MipA/OmpV family protein [Dyella sp.]|uniref:MipA/OmpV family protein n=1 Tax=Dyella sp. TaxID=1869338 RepID=UPI002ED09445
MRRRRHAPLALLWGIAALGASQAHGEDAPAAPDLTNYIGAGVIRMPGWLGSNNHRDQWAPFVQVTVDKVITLSTSDGLTVDFIHHDGWQGGLYGNYMWGRSHDDLGARLAGKIDSLSPRLNGGGYIEYHPNEAMNFGATLSHDTQGAGAYFNLYLDSGLPPIWGIEHSVQIQWQAMNQAAMRRFFGVTYDQAALLGTQAWRPGAGGQQIELEYDAMVPVTRRTGILFALDYARLLGDAADSPLVRHFGSANQISTSLGLVYRF